MNTTNFAREGTAAVVISPVDIDNAPYRYELWKLDTNTLIHVRLTGRFLELDDPALIEPSAFQGYPIGYEWRLYRQHRELGRWTAPEVATLTRQEHGQVGAA